MTFLNLRYREVERWNSRNRSQSVEGRAGDESMSWQHWIIEHDESDRPFVALHEYHPDLGSGVVLLDEPVTFAAQDPVTLISLLD